MSLIDQILETYSQEEPTFVVALPLGEKFTFRHFEDYDDLDRYKLGSVAFAQLLNEDGTPGPEMHPEMAKIAPEGMIGRVRAPGQR